MTNPQPFLPGDIVERTGETAMGLVKGERYRVQAAFFVPPSKVRWLKFAEAPDAEFPARGFKLVEGAGR